MPLASPALGLFRMAMVAGLGMSVPAGRKAIVTAPPSVIFTSLAFV